MPPPGEAAAATRAYREFLTLPGAPVDVVSNPRELAFYTGFALGAQFGRSDHSCAAPELLERLKAHLDWQEGGLLVEDERRFLEHTRRLIAKAEGR